MLLAGSNSWKNSASLPTIWFLSRIPCLLSNLKLLDVSGNRLRVLPDSISKCRYILGPSHFFLLNSEQESSL